MYALCVCVFEGVPWKEGIQLQMHLKVTPPPPFCTHTHRHHHISMEVLFDVKVTNSSCLKRSLQHAVLQTANVN